MPVFPFRRQTKKRGRKSGGRSDVDSSVKSTSLSLANKLQILALENPVVVRVIEKIVDGAIEELGKV